MKKCNNCDRKATSWGFLRSENKIAYYCGYHTWWFGTQAEPEYKQRLKEKYTLNV